MAQAKVSGDSSYDGADGDPDDDRSSEDSDSDEGAERSRHVHPALKKIRLYSEQQNWLKAQKDVFIDRTQLQIIDIANMLLERGHFLTLPHQGEFQKITLRCEIPMKRLEIFLEHLQNRERAFFADFLDVLSDKMYCPDLFDTPQEKLGTSQRPASKVKTFAEALAAWGPGTKFATTGVLTPEAKQILEDRF